MYWMRRFIFNFEVFKIVCLVLSILLSIPYFYNYITYLKVLHIYAVCIVIIDLITEKRMLQNKGKAFIYLLIISYLFTMLFNRELISVSHLSDFGYVCIQFLILFSYSENKKSSLKLFTYVYLILITLLNCTAIIMFINQFQSFVNGSYIGMYPHQYRLCGFFGNPAVLSFVSFFAVALSLVALTFNKSKRKIISIMIVFCFIINFFTLILANARTTIISSFVLFFVCFILYTFKHSMKKAKIISIGILIIISNIAGINLCKSIASISIRQYKDALNQNQQDILLANQNDNSSINQVVTDTKTEYTIPGRESDGLNGRAEIWKNGINLLFKNPVFGIGLNNVNYKLSQLNYKLVDINGSLHNSYLEFAVSFGFIGVIIILLLFLSVIDNCARYLNKCKEDEQFTSAIVIMAFLCSILIMGFADSSLLFSMYPTSVMLCCMLGYLYNIINHAFNNNKINNKTYLSCITERFKQHSITDKSKVCFVIDSLGGGGAEKILTTVTNAICDKHDITILTLWSGEVLEKDLDEKINLLSFDHFYLRSLKRCLYWLNRHFLPKKIINVIYLNYRYDYCVAFLEGLPTKLIASTKSKSTIKYSWVHIDLLKRNWVSNYFRNIEDQEAVYNKFDKIFCVSESVKTSFNKVFKCKAKIEVQLNLVDTRNITQLGSELIHDIKKDDNKFRIYSIGRLNDQKGYDRLIKVIKKLKDEGYESELWIIGEGEKRKELEELIYTLQLEDTIFLKGFQTNPYKYAKYCDLFICSSRAEGYSTVITENLILGKAIVATECSGVPEQLGNNEYGVIVENSETGIYDGIKYFMDNKDLIHDYENKALIRAKDCEYEKIKKEYDLLFQKY